MKEIIKQIRSRAAAQSKRIVLPETEDLRVLKAASFLAEQGICRVILLGDEQAIHPKAAQNGIKLEDDIEILSPAKANDMEGLVQHLFERRKHKGITQREAAEMLKNPLYFAAGLVATDQADGCVTGSVATTGEVIRAAIHTIGLRPGNNTVSSTFLMALQEGKALTYADCGVVPYPDAKQLADIAVESARTHRLLTEEDPVVAMLSFSTKGSAEHERTMLVRDAMELVRQKAPDLAVDGELQFDAAYVPEVAGRKAPDSKVAGKANVFIFPNLDAGNIAYKITERLAGASATGPILQGLAKPMMDLSRGCSWQDIINVAAVAVLMGEG
ncbi:MAG TPA: phosphate acetyltransferase [Balneolaceae bacterium]|nr:phosphate acetyltransferase [Balneolaceae bacterium]